MKRNDKSKAGVPSRKKAKRSEAIVIGPSWIEKYLDNRYIDRGEGEIYAQDSNGAELYNTTKEGDTFYAKKRMIIDDEEQIVEYPAKDANKQTVLIDDPKGGVKYPMNLTTNQPFLQMDWVYPLQNGKRVYLRDSHGKPIYYKDSAGQFTFLKENGMEIYGTDDEGNEVYPTTNGLAFAITHNIRGSDISIYAKNKNKDEYYFTDEHNDEIYLRHENIEVGAQRSDGSYYYAKKANGSEYYPKIYLMNESEKDGNVNIDENLDEDMINENGVDENKDVFGKVKEEIKIEIKKENVIDP